MKLAISQGLALEGELEDGVEGCSRAKVSTIDGSQGHENEITILDLTQSNLKEPEKVGFLSDPRRLNVAIARAKQVLLIVGNLSLWWPVVGKIEHQRAAPAFTHLLRDVCPGSVVDWTQAQVNHMLRPRPVPAIAGQSANPRLVPAAAPQNAWNSGRLLEDRGEAVESVKGWQTEGC
ncbi:DEAD-box type RNA helicase [Hypocenomyce scalaris]|nr:DEAD-box type RNA helicase [Hypocenomyce scalaris]